MAENENVKSKINIRNIKSSYILKTLLSFLNEKQKLNMIKYNKGFQKMFSLELKDFKRTSNRYKIAEKNGKGKEYILNTSLIIFEGEYLNGKRNGKGKEYYDDGKLEFKGEYINGKRRKGKEYYDDGKLEFEGEYLNGKRNGKGKNYYYDGKIEFEGEYLNGKRWNGKGYNKNGNVEFEIKNGDGKVKEYYYFIYLKE